MKVFIPLVLFFVFVIRCEAQLFASYKQGYYIDANGSVHQGLIKAGAGDNFPIKFKETKESKMLKCKPDDIAGYVIDKDSFAVVRNFEVPYSLTGAIIDVAFAKVIKVGRVTLYQNTVLLGAGNTQVSMESYLLKKGNNLDIVRVPTGPGRFKKRLSEFFSDFPKMSQQIENGTLTYDYILIMVDNYNKEFSTKTSSATP
ncbi:hypothetical protein [Xanthocytophaga agilis]|uniref:Uncharacterized protein n=1 Tax=Xanthocytophaga agilis TaxID=3048010 RepID=A0AAE3R0I5_9BACT|nr:hypothetical protein [Xanthocytophaga agilis]MDJ1499459.1 hypothetical protein [Xanthocytophaga agilis]